VTAAVLMSVYLITSSVVTTLLIPPTAFQPGGPANGRALAYLAHHYLGETFGTVYDVSTILIPVVRGASAMAGLLNIVPRYLPRYGMPRNGRGRHVRWSLSLPLLPLRSRSPSKRTWTRRAVPMRPCSLPDDLRRRRGDHLRDPLRHKVKGTGFGVVALVFAYTTVVNVIERPDGIKIAALFIGVIVLMSLVSRVWRTLELRVDCVEIDDTAQQFLADLTEMHQPIHLVANDPDLRDARNITTKRSKHAPTTVFPTRSRSISSRCMSRTRPRSRTR